ncbi:hypothetical protein BVY01_00370 [bacterium I07]|nr:hypothetical protein BVY01_00370 [bacterium I07]
MEMKHGRLLSLDVFRGMTIAGMIIVNGPGNDDFVFPQLAHSEWNGCTFADFIFPFFLFIVGVAITLSLSKRKGRGDNQIRLMMKTFRRSAIIFLLGLVLGLFPVFDITNLVLTGVLKTIAVVYFFTALIFLITDLKTQKIILAVILVVYWIAITFLPDPGAVAANLSRGTNLGEWLNKFFSQNSLLRSCWDIFGRITTVPAVATSLLGVLTGNLLLSNEDNTTKTVKMFIVGNIMIFTAYILSFWFPINKLMWTSTFVLFTGGFALNLFSLCFWVVDVKEYKFWIKPFQAFGMNALAVYFMAVLAGRYLKFIKVTDSSGNLVNLKGYIYNAVFLPLADPINASFIYSIVYTLFWLGFVWFLFKKKIFIKV